jgi:hypothetical protein
MFVKEKINGPLIQVCDGPLFDPKPISKMLGGLKVSLNRTRGMTPLQ